MTDVLPGCEKKMLTGYQYGDDMTFTCVYLFPNNEDQPAIHMPPRTTLVAPPAVDAGMVPQYEAASDSWTVVPKPELAPPQRGVAP